MIVEIINISKKYGC